jgi:hypothetical protein
MLAKNVDSLVYKWYKIFLFCAGNQGNILKREHE